MTGRASGGRTIAGAVERRLRRLRLKNQRLTQSSFQRPADVVAWLGAVQAQDYTGAKWGIGQRGVGITDRMIDDAFDAGEILRTHVMRPTWHMVSPADIGWILALTGPRVHQSNGHMYRRLQVDKPVLAKSRRVFERALRDRRYLTRQELQTALASAGVAAEGHRLAYIVMHAELEGVVCSGPRRVRQITYGLLGERAPAARRLDRDEARFELAQRYLRSHGPATVRDFSWWSGLTMADSTAAFASLGTAIESEVVGDRRYLFFPKEAESRAAGTSLYLLPNYDEALIAYRDRDSAGKGPPPAPRAADPHPHHLLLNGRVAGSWSRDIGPARARVQVASYHPLSAGERKALSAATRDYGTFLALPIELSGA